MCHVTVQNGGPWLISLSHVCAICLLGLLVSRVPSARTSGGGAVPEASAVMQGSCLSSLCCSSVRKVEDRPSLWLTKILLVMWFLGKHLPHKQEAFEAPALLWLAEEGSRETGQEPTSSSFLGDPHFHLHCTWCRVLGGSWVTLGCHPVTVGSWLDTDGVWISVGEFSLTWFTFPFHWLWEIGKLGIILNMLLVFKIILRKKTTKNGTSSYLQDFPGCILLQTMKGKVLLQTGCTHLSLVTMIGTLSILSSQGSFTLI